MQRRIELDGVSNFRDLGGYRAGDGRTVRWRTLFRSDTLAGLSDADLAVVERLGISAACDLRYGEERELEPSRLLGHDRIAVLALGLDARPGATFLDSFEVAVDKEDAARRYLLENYAEYPFRYAKAYRTMAERLIVGERIVVHCTAGKDRAGTAAAMLLTALGVPRETVFEDYLLTNRYWDRGDRAPADMDPGAVAAIFSAREEYLASAFAAVEARYGSAETYLETEVGLDETKLEALRAACLE